MSDNQISPAATFASPVSGAPISADSHKIYDELKVRQMDMVNLCDFAVTLAHDLVRNADNTLVYVPAFGDDAPNIDDMCGLYRQENSPLVTLAASLGDEGTLGHAILFNQGFIDGLKVNKENDQLMIDTMQECIDTTQFDLRQANDLICALQREMSSNTQK